MSQSRPRIGVTRWEEVPGEPIESYWERIEMAGGEPVDLRGTDILVTSLDGLMLTGGLDIDPSRYGEKPHERTKVAEAERDGILQGTDFELRPGEGLLIHAREPISPVQP